MLDCFGKILEEENVIFRAFLRNNMYIPPEMQPSMFLPLDEEDHDITFSCHTTIMSDILLHSEIDKHKNRKKRWFP
jgi:hypothetical protein